VIVPNAQDVDDSGRRISSAANKDLPNVPKCRCGTWCKCGLADALRLLHEDPHKHMAQAALCIENLSADVDEQDLWSFFAPVAQTTTVRVVRNTKTLRSQLHGFINFRTFYDAERALSILHGQQIRGRPCRISWSSRALRSKEEGVAASPSTSMPPIDETCSTACSCTDAQLQRNSAHSVDPQLQHNDWQSWGESNSWWSQWSQNQWSGGTWSQRSSQGTRWRGRRGGGNGTSKETHAQGRSGSWIDDAFDKPKASQAGHGPGRGHHRYRGKATDVKKEPHKSAENTSIDSTKPASIQEVRTW